MSAAELLIRCVVIYADGRWSPQFPVTVEPGVDITELQKTIQKTKGIPTVPANLDLWLPLNSISSDLKATRDALKGLYNELDFCDPDRADGVARFLDCEEQVTQELFENLGPEDLQIIVQAPKGKKIHRW